MQFVKQSRTHEYVDVAGPSRQLLITGKPEYLGQLLASLAVSLGPLASGLGKGYSSPAIASLLQRDAKAFDLNGQQASWLASLSLLGALFGAPLGGVAVKWGRKRALLMAGAPLSLCWILTGFAFSVEIMCFAAFTSGFLVAIVQLAAQMYVSEIAAPSIRGGLSALLKISGHAGSLVAFAAGAFLDWRQLAGLISFAPAAMCLAMLRIPESPGWLVLKGYDSEAEKALRWLRGDSADLQLELSILQTHIMSKRISSSPKLLLQTLRTPALISCGLMFFQRFSGAHAFHFYVVSVFKETFGGTNPHTAAVAVAVVQLLSALLSGLLVDSAGRLPLLVASSVLMSLALASFGSFAYYKEANPKSVTNLDWIPLLCVLVFTVAFSLGISPISWLLVSELFSLEHRGLGTALATGFSYLCAFVGVKTFVDFREWLGLYGAFWLYAFISVCGLCFVVCCVPETKGRDLTEIDTVS
uniref:Major facilitator superfamily (MFS) profile domain-containing protein n=2 Tax=Dendroctonus ponderosae TaxID=77166 RepID=A0AAR5PU89_DENPD